ncbi:hypothetical protein Ahy_B08g089314 [Arachis hypogaea]|uniref:NADP-dependent oxidoreductase domain-containing protein n=1 Tax=Arachis hypogaea TaxID=3818 RepID=A0A444XXD8_ARAHY|nr:hypothetical protein Ahy_B08g089314 [Arachis hypogaea]
MAEVQSIHIPRVKLGNQGFEVSKLGFGCANLTGAYAAGVSEEEGISIIKHAFNKGITFFDTSDIYGLNANEILVGKALKQLPRKKIQIATKFGVEKLINGTPSYVRSCCEASLKRLGVEYIDLYYQHRVDTTVSIEDTMGELKKLVKEGKVKYIGLSEASSDTIKRAHAVHPITALGIGIVPYSPLGRGFFGGKGVVENLPADSLLNTHPRYQAQNLEKNKKIYERIENLAKKHQCSPVQLALAWIFQQGNDVAPIPGTTKIKNLDQNVGALALRLEERVLKEISDAVPIEDVAGTHHFNETYGKVTWKFSNTPPKDRFKYLSLKN